MARILTGIQSTGRPHLGNILGAIKPAVDLANEANNALHKRQNEYYAMVTGMATVCYSKINI